jgi:hypothetical protein
MRGKIKESDHQDWSRQVYRAATKNKEKTNRLLEPGHRRAGRATMGIRMRLEGLGCRDRWLYLRIEAAR